MIQKWFTNTLLVKNWATVKIRIACQFEQSFKGILCPVTHLKKGCVKEVVHKEGFECIHLEDTSSQYHAFSVVEWAWFIIHSVQLL